MLWIIARQELRRLLRSRRLQMLACMTWLLTGLALLSSWQETRHYLQLHHEIETRQQAMWNRQGELNPHTAAHHGLYAFKPWNSLSSWEPGLLPYLGSAVFLEAHKQHFEQYRAAQDQIRLSRLAPLSLASLFQYLVPLLIILLGYALISDERSQGTLKLLLVQGASPGQLFLGKALALGLTLGLLLAPMLLLGLVLLGLTAPLPWTRLLPFLAAYALYWLIFIWLSLLVSARLPNSRLALLGLLSFWFLNCLIVPRAGLGWLQAWHPLPTAAAFQQAIQAERESLPDWNTRQENLTQSLLAEYQLEQVADLPVNLEGLILKASEADDTAIYSRHFAALYARYAQDSRRYAQWGWFFPTLALQNLSQALAATDFSQHHGFLQAAERYRFDYVQFLNQDIVARPDQSAFEYVSDQTLWQQIQPFSYSLPRVRQVLWQEADSLAALLLWVGLLLGGTPWLLKRMQVLP